MLGVVTCTNVNMNCFRSLLDQLKELQALVASTHPTKAQAGTCLMVLFLAFGLVLFPINNAPGEQKEAVAKYAPAIGKSLLLGGGGVGRGINDKDFISFNLVFFIRFFESLEIPLY